jgi:galactose-1-phosphate uridylyltransferase
LTVPVITNVLLNRENKTRVYYDEKGHPMQASALVRDPQFRVRVVAETPALLAVNSK